MVLKCEVAGSFWWDVILSGFSREEPALSGVEGSYGCQSLISRQPGRPVNYTVSPSGRKVLRGLKATQDDIRSECG